VKVNDILICLQPSLAISRWPEIRMHLEKSGQKSVVNAYSQDEENLWEDRNW